MTTRIMPVSARNFNGPIEDAEFVSLGPEKSNDFVKRAGHKVALKSGIMAVKQGLSGLCKAFGKVAMPAIGLLVKLDNWTTEKEVKKADIKRAKKRQKEHLKDLKKKGLSRDNSEGEEVKNALSHVREGLSKEDRKFMDQLLKADPQMQTNEVRQSIALVELLQNASKQANRSGQKYNFYMAENACMSTYLCSSDKPVSLTSIYSYIKQKGSERVNTNKMRAELSG